ncbi:hypothetical protein [Macrococcus capreoli]|uniref:hypothetical protein n=1 Tax=Macrococcus capreoli TaxID=2982690 RepID=UPI003EE65D61
MNKMDIILSKINERTNFNSLMESIENLNIEYEIINKNTELKYDIEESIVEQKSILLSDAEISSTKMTTIELPFNISAPKITKKSLVEKMFYNTNKDEELIA